MGSESEQTLHGSFSAVSKPIFPTKTSDKQNRTICPPMLQLRCCPEREPRRRKTQRQWHPPHGIPVIETSAASQLFNHFHLDRRQILISILSQTNRCEQQEIS